MTDKSWANINWQPIGSLSLIRSMVDSLLDERKSNMPTSNPAVRSRMWGHLTKRKFMYAKAQQQPFYGRQAGWMSRLGL
jgi:hypothetical protein